MDNDRDVNSLRNELNRIDKEKEEAFSICNSNRKKLIEFGSKAKVLKKERNLITDSVRKIKSERDELNKQLKLKIEEFKKIAPKKKEKPKVHVNTGLLRKEIKAMEYKIETEGLDFNKEQKLMKVIKEKKKQLDEVVNGGLSPEAVKLSNEIDSIRKKADEKHREMRIKADESQKKHEEVIKTFNELKEAEKIQREIESKIRESKQNIDELNQKLGNKLEEAVQQKKEYTERKEHRKEHTKFNKRKQFNHEHKHVNIQALQQKAEEKLKKGGKLTTEDLLAFQEKK